MASFDDREKGYEGRFAHDQELEFRIRARRDKLLARWVAPQLGLNAAESETYSKSLVASAFEKDREDKLAARILKDLSAKGVETTERHLRKRMDELHDEAREQVMKETKAT
jgi:hypothetical protein